MGTRWEIAECNEAFYTPPHGEKSTHNSGRNTFSVFWLLWAMASDILQDFWRIRGVFWTVSIQQGYVRAYVRGRQRRAKRVQREFRRVSCFGLVKINELCPWCETQEHNSPGFPRREPCDWTAGPASPGLLVVSVWLKKGTKTEPCRMNWILFLFFSFIIFFFRFILETCESTHEHFFFISSSRFQVC